MQIHLAYENTVPLVPSQFQRALKPWSSEVAAQALQLLRRHVSKSAFRFANDFLNIFLNRKPFSHA